MLQQSWESAPSQNCLLRSADGRLRPHGRPPPRRTKGTSWIRKLICCADAQLSQSFWNVNKSSCQMWFSAMPAPGMKNQVIHRQNSQGQGWHDVTSSNLNLRAMKTYKLNSNSSERPRRHLRSYSFQGHRTVLPCVDNVAALFTQLKERKSHNSVFFTGQQQQRPELSICKLHLGQGLSTFLSLFHSHWQPLQRLCSGYYNPFYANLISVPSLKFKQFSRDSTTVLPVPSV